MKSNYIRVRPDLINMYEDKVLLFRNIIINKSFRLWCGPRYKQEKSKRTEQRVQKPRQLVQLFCPGTTTTGQDPAWSKFEANLNGIQADGRGADFLIYQQSHYSAKSMLTRAVVTIIP